jgi:hypothetical protein
VYTLAQMLNIGAWLKGVVGLIPEVITAAAGHDNTLVKGPAIDREAAGFGLHMSAKATLLYVANINTAESLTGAFKVQHSVDTTDGNFSDFTDEYGNGVITTTTLESGLLTNKAGVMEINICLLGAKRYIRLASTLNLSRSGTDTVAYAGLVEFGGVETIPQTDQSYSVTA